MSSYNPRESVFNQPKPVVHLPHELLDAVTKSVEPYPIPEGRKYEYGTAGFRMKAYVSPSSAASDTSLPSRNTPLTKSRI
ncbi:Phosphoacetylglucosamine Mutase [Vermiconidia calcicola]|uniref:Phosphoacetylglucosamine Mutase n=1 Tax=Vermiconidia calcicola TaxID=1690605 RepID=A0AAV9Q328_9PEZI|nr:Phosphoacetylglucosamine Mutase [Vermiconidia calcicola]